MDWKGKIKVDKVDEKMKILCNKTSLKFHKSLNQQNSSLNILNDIQNQFVATPIDKANENVSLICQQFYVLIIIKKLDLDHTNSGRNNTCIPVHKTNNQGISRYPRFLRN